MIQRLQKMTALAAFHPKIEKSLKRWMQTREPVRRARKRKRKEGKGEEGEGTKGKEREASKEIDRTPPLPKKPVILIFIMALSILILILLGSPICSMDRTCSRQRMILQAAPM